MGEPAGDDRAAVARRFYDAFLADDFEALASLLVGDAFWSIDGRTLISGEYHGRDAVVGLFRTIKTLTGGTFRPAGPDTWDILVSPYHVAILDLFLGEREGRALRSHEAWIVELREGRIAAGFHFVESMENFAAFWS